MILDYKTASVCPKCAKEAPAHYETRPDGVHLISECPEHGVFTERAERDIDSFLWGYDQDYVKPHTHLVLPATYRCNINCTYCYTLSNTKLAMPDRSQDDIKKLIGSFEGNVTFIGGEPTLREDLPEIIAAAKATPSIGKVSIATNGQLLRDRRRVEMLKDAGIDFIFFSFNNVEYEASSTVHKNKLQALEHCYNLRMPVWLQGTISELHHLDSFISVLREVKRVVFKVTLRSVRAMGLRHPKDEVFVSDILEYLGKKDSVRKGTSPFNRFVRLEGREAKICAWVYDIGRIDPVDSDYVISNDTFTKLHRGIREDEVLLRRRLFGEGMGLSDPELVRSVMKKVSV